MSLKEQQSVVARLVSNAPFRMRFFNAPADAHAEFGLTPDEFAALRKLDAFRVSVAGGGNVYKRFDQVEPAFRATLAILERSHPQVREDYAARTPFSTDIARELDSFLAYALALDVPAHERAIVDVVARLERKARALPPVTPRAARDDEARPRLSRGAMVERAPFDVADALDAALTGRALPRVDAATTSATLVWNAGGKVTWERLEGWQADLVAACDGTRPMRDLATRAPLARDELGRWLAAGILDA